MTGTALISAAALPGAMAIAGFVFGRLYFALLWRTVGRFAVGRGWLDPLALTLGRMGAAVILLTIAAKLGAAPLLATFLGFMLARAVALRAARRAG